LTGEGSPLDNINGTLERMLEVMNKPEHPVIKFLLVAGMVAGIFSIMSTIDIIIKWF